METFLIKPKEETLKALYERHRQGVQLNEDLRPLSEAALISTEVNYKRWSNVNDTIIERLFSDTTVRQRFVEKSLKKMVTPVSLKKNLPNDISKLQRKISNELVALQIIIDEVNEDLFEQQSSVMSTYKQNGTLETIILICRNFNNFANSIKEDPHGKASIQAATIRNEYDMQFYFGAILSIHFNDYLPEESTASLGGKSSSIDFILKREKIAVELKIDITRDELIKQLNDDITKYKKHPDIINGTLICCVYDPEKKIKQPIPLEKDYDDIDHGSLRVKLIITQ